MSRALLWLVPALALGAEKVEILRDEYGVAHIYAATPAGAAYGSGYTQASDRLEEMMRNFRKAEGTMAEVFGPEWYRHDYRQRMWRHREIAERHYAELSAQVRVILEGFAAGARKYMEEHPERVPAWAVRPEPWRVVALGRFTIWRWPEGEAGGDLQRAGIEQDPPPYTGSNQWLIAPWRTAMRAPIAVIDPHLSWYGETRYYEMRLYAGDWGYSGGARVGLPFPTLGHSRYVSVAMTTGGPDTSAVSESAVEQPAGESGDVSLLGWLDRLIAKGNELKSPNRGRSGMHELKPYRDEAARCLGHLGPQLDAARIEVADLRLTTPTNISSRHGQESFLTTKHRCTVAARIVEVLQIAKRRFLAPPPGSPRNEILAKLKRRVQELHAKGMKHEQLCAQLDFEECGLPPGAKWPAQNWEQALRVAPKRVRPWLSKAIHD